MSIGAEDISRTSCSLAMAFAFRLLSFFFSTAGPLSPELSLAADTFREMVCCSGPALEWAVMFSTRRPLPEDVSRLFLFGVC